MKLKLIIGFSILSIIFGSTLSVSRAQGNDTCGTTESSPALDDVVRNSDGSVLHMSWYEALVYCSEHGTRLPTARELANYSHSLGAQGVCKIEKKGYYQIRGTDTKDKSDDFFFSPKGYRQPDDELGSLFFWSSSSFLSGWAYGLVGKNGRLFNDLSTGKDSSGYSDITAVRCVSNLTWRK